MSAETDLITIVRKYFDAIENGEPGESLQFFAEDVVQEEFPNRLVPGGATRDLAALKEAAARGRKVMTRQRYDIVNALASGNQVAVEARHGSGAASDGAFCCSSCCRSSS